MKTLNWPFFTWIFFVVESDKEHLLNLIPRPISSFSMLHTEKWESLVRKVTCGMSWWSNVTQTKSRLIEANKTGLFLRYPCLLSTTNVRFELLKDRLLLVWQQYSRASCHLLAVALISPVTFDPRGSLDLLPPSLSITWLRIPGPPAFQLATLKSWEWDWRQGYTCSGHVVIDLKHWHVHAHTSTTSTCYIILLLV